MQIWKGDGKIVLLPDGNRVCEIEASKSRMKDLKQEFHLGQLQQVEILFRARSIDYTGPGIRISIHQHGGGSLIWNRDLPQDGSWREFRVVYTRTTAANDLRELNIATLLGNGQIQIDDVEVREPSKVVQNEPPEPVPPPSATPVPTPKPLPPIAFVKPPAPLVPAAPLPPTNQPPSPSVPPGTFASLEQIINSAPAAALLKVQNEATLDEGVAEIDQYLGRSVKGRPARLHVNIDQTRPDISTESRFLVHVSDHPATNWNGVSLTAWLWVKFPEGVKPAADKLTSGSEPTVSGVITRCQIGKAAHLQVGHLHLDVDLGESKIGSP